MRANLEQLLATKRVSKRGQLSATACLEAPITIRKVDNEEQVVIGEVYAPYVIDSHGEMMLPEDVKKLAYRFLLEKKTDRIDIMHNNKAIKAAMVESYIAKAGDPDFAEGAWVLAVKIFDDKVWADIKAGKLNGYSLEAMVYKQEAEVIYDYLPIHYGFTEENDGHFHAFLVEVDKTGCVIGGYTSEEEDSEGNFHDHSVLAGTATEKSNEHAHRYFLNEIE
jgi:hypothetical protein